MKHLAMRALSWAFYQDISQRYHTSPLTWFTAGSPAARTRGRLKINLWFRLLNPLCDLLSLSSFNIISRGSNDAGTAPAAAVKPRLNIYKVQLGTRASPLHFPINLIQQSKDWGLHNQTKPDNRTKAGRSVLALLYQAVAPAGPINLTIILLSAQPAAPRVSINLNN